MDEVRLEWGRIPNKSAFFILGAAWAALFHFLGNSTFGYIDTPSLFGWMYGAYNVPMSEDGHGNLIPFVVLGLLWWKREQIAQIDAKPSFIPIVFVAFALALHLVGYMVQQPRLSIIAFFVGLYGLVGQVWGIQTMRVIFFPYILLGFCIPLGSLAESVTFPLRMLVSKIAVGVSHTILGIDVIRDGSQIFDSRRTFRYDVAPACSGIRSLISILVLSTIYGAVTFRPLWKRWLTVALAIPLAIMGNVLRIMGVIIAAEAFGQDAGQTVEQKLGFLTFAVAIGAMVLLGKWLQDPPLKTSAKPSSPELSDSV